MYLSLVLTILNRERSLLYPLLYGHPKLQRCVHFFSDICMKKMVMSPKHAADTYIVVLAGQRSSFKVNSIAAKEKQLQHCLSIEVFGILWGIGCNWSFKTNTQQCDCRWSWFIADRCIALALGYMFWGYSDLGLQLHFTKIVPEGIFIDIIHSCMQWLYLHSMIDSIDCFLGLSAPRVI